jgi:hypothetical protein
MGVKDQPTSLLRTAAKQQRDKLQHAGYLDGLESFVATKKGHPGHVGLMLMHHTHHDISGVEKINFTREPKFSQNRHKSRKI